MLKRVLESRPLREPKPPFILLETDAPLLEKIPGAFAAPLKLAHAGNGYEAIAGMLGIPIGTVKSRVYRARDYVRKLRAEAVVVPMPPSDQPTESAGV